jgi:hypothetical protein
MDRRKFLSTLIGGVATAAAVRTFPFRVFSFPSEIKTFDPIIAGRGRALTYEGILEVKVPQSVAIWASPMGGPYRLVEEVSLAEAKARYGYEWRAPETGLRVELEWSPPAIIRPE